MSNEKVYYALSGDTLREAKEQARKLAAEWFEVDETDINLKVTQTEAVTYEERGSDRTEQYLTGYIAEVTAWVSTDEEEKPVSIRNSWGAA